ncbi:prespore protein Dp87-like [Palaemon carinicauda]|uniref:prespore protein Dp87-like n=1 Tax=Palaemon carinicauda TaxID=392227 RepID=UPI0035B68FE4
MKVYKSLVTSCMLLALLSSLVTGENDRKYITKSGRDASFQKQGAIFTKTINADCVDTVTCGTEPFVPKCTNCDPRYFYCPNPGATPLEKECAPGNLFNTDPHYPKCVLADNCPYHPPWIVSTTPKPPHPTAVTTDGGCVDTIICKSQKFVPKCATCDPRYFYCKQPGASPLEMTCSSGLVFNTDPAYPRCVLSDNCPYHPPWTLSSTTSTAATTTTTTTTTTVPSTTTKSTTTTSTTATAKTSAVPTTVNQQSSTMTSSYSTDSTTLTSDASQDPTSTASSDMQSTTPDCLDSHTCTEEEVEKDFARCASCKPEYFHCGKTAGALAEVILCENKQVFNTNPDYPGCISPINCPYYP